jgi:CO dehydrogenase maturation factor
MNPSVEKLIVNRAPSTELAPGILEEIKKYNLDLIGVVPQDEKVYEFDSEGVPTVKLPEDSAARRAFNEIACKLFS